MNAFKAVSAVSTRRGFWMDYESNRDNKRRSRSKARHTLNGKTFKEILLDKSGSVCYN